MWATSQLSRTEEERRRGFTIVELLIVIVVIGILAAIVIVAYNGVTQQARVASIKSDLDGAVKQLFIDQVNNSAYPATVAAANNGAGLQASPGTTYQYSVNNTASPQTFCITVTNGTTSYFVSSTNNVATAGACPGQGANGVAAVTNLMTNPSLEGGSVAPNWAYNGAPLSIDTTMAAFGTSSLKAVTNSTTNAQGLVFSGQGGPAGTYTCSVYLASSPATVVYVSGRTESPYAEQLGTKSMNLTNTFQRISVTFTLSTSVGAIEIQTPLTAAASGVTIWGDAAMCVSGSTNPGYADGSSTNWVWNGTANASTSTGPPF